MLGDFKELFLINLKKWLYKQQCSQAKKYLSQRLSRFVEQCFCNPV